MPTSRPKSCECGDTLGGCDRASQEMHLEAVIESVWTHALVGHDQAGLEEYLEGVNLEAVVQEGGETGAEILFLL